MDLLEALENEGFAVPPEVHDASQRLDGQYLISCYPNGAGCPPQRLYNSRIARELLDVAATVLAFVRNFSPAFERQKLCREITARGKASLERPWSLCPWQTGLFC